MAVLPTPGSLNRIGLFLDRRPFWIVRSTSSSRPITGSTFPSLAFCVKSTQKSFKGETWQPSPAASETPRRASRGRRGWRRHRAALGGATPCSRSPFSRRRASVFKTSGSTPTASKNATIVTSSRNRRRRRDVLGRDVVHADVLRLLQRRSSNTRFAPRVIWTCLLCSRGRPRTRRRTMRSPSPSRERSRWSCPSRGSPLSSPPRRRGPSRCAPSQPPGDAAPWLRCASITALMARSVNFSNTAVTTSAPRGCRSFRFRHGCGYRRSRLKVRGDARFDDDIRRRKRLWGKSQTSGRLTSAAIDRENRSKRQTARASACPI